MSDGMKKNILFVMNNLNCGGAEKALISVLESIDYAKYHVDLFLFKHEGIFINKIPKIVNLLPEPANYRYFDMPIKKSLKELFMKGNIKIALNRIRLGYLAKTEKNGSIVEQKIWKHLSSSIPAIKKEYDVAIGFQEKNPIYFCIDKVKAKKKIGWIHTDYEKLGINKEKDQLYFKRLDYLVTVSDDLVKKLKEIFPDLSRKISSIHNIISTNMINKMALEEVDFNNFSNNNISIISVGRLAKEKGLDLSLDAIEILNKRGYSVSWNLIGEGNIREELELGIKTKKLEGKVFLLGMKENPYPYIRESDIFIQTSKFEGKSISIEEAKVLAKPILITNFDTSRNHIKNGENGIISNMDSFSIANDLEKLINDKCLRNKLIKNLQEEYYGTENEINKLYHLIEC
jgi:glycosyltransferase involved in cell wall biosynthesis